MEDIFFKILSAALTVLALILSWYKIFVTKPIDKTKKELANLDYEIKKHQAELDKEYPYIEFDFNIKHYHNDNNKYAILIDVICKNKGREIAECLVSSEILTIAKANWKDESVQFGRHTFGQFYRLEDNESTSWKLYTIFPEAKSNFPFYARIDSKGIYYIQIKIKMSDNNERAFRERFPNFTSDPLHWIGSTYYNVS